MKPSGPLTLAACTIGLALSLVPIFFAGTAVLMVPISTQTGWSRGDVSAFISAALVGMSLGAVIVGKLINLWGPRRIILWGVVAFPLSLVAFSFSTTIASAVALAFLVGLIGAAVSQFSYITVLPLFFERRLGMSLGIAMFGMGLGVALVPLLLQFLEQSVDWRSIYRILAAIVFAASAPIVGLFLREPSVAIDTQNAAVNPEEGSRQPDGMTAKEALRGRVFWQLGLATILATTVITGLGLHITALMTDRGYTRPQAAAIFSIWGIGGALARVVCGAVLDYFAARRVGAFFLVAAAIGASILLSGVTGAAVACAVFVLATANGLENDLLPYMTRRYFGLRSYGTLYGLLGFGFVIGPAAGSVLIGRAFDRFGNYDLVLWFVMGANLAAALLLVTLGKPAPLKRESTARASESRDTATNHPPSFPQRRDSSGVVL
jgi:OFA family oxalate/formate antiporter-like MFS transporter